MEYIHKCQLYKEECYVIAKKLRTVVTFAREKRMDVKGPGGQLGAPAVCMTIWS